MRSSFSSSLIPKPLTGLINAVALKPLMCLPKIRGYDPRRHWFDTLSLAVKKQSGAIRSKRLDPMGISGQCKLLEDVDAARRRTPSPSRLLAEQNPVCVVVFDLLKPRGSPVLDRRIQG
jgi:hypothetical protein